MASDAPERKYIKLLPGEDILLREDSCLLAGAFSAEAAGTLFLTNYRLLFSGSFAQAPDEKDHTHHTAHSDIGQYPLDFDLAKKPDSASPLVTRQMTERCEMRPRGGENVITKGLKRSQSMDRVKGGTGQKAESGGVLDSLRSLHRMHGASMSSSSRFYVQDEADELDLQVDEDHFGPESNAALGVRKSSTVSLKSSPGSLGESSVPSSTTTAASSPSRFRTWSDFEVVGDDGDVTGTVALAPGRISGPTPHNSVGTASQRDMASIREESSSLMPGGSVLERDHPVAVQAAPLRPTSGGKDGGRSNATAAAAAEGASTDSSSGHWAPGDNDVQQRPRSSVATTSLPVPCDEALRRSSLLDVDGSASLLLETAEELAKHREGIVPRRRLSSQFFVSLPGTSAIDMEVAADHDIRISMPLRAIAKTTHTQPLLVRHAPRSRQSIKLTMECLEVAMQTGQLYKLCAVSLQIVLSIQSLVKDLCSRITESDHHFAQVHFKSILEGRGASPQSTTVSSPIEKGGRDFIDVMAAASSSKESLRKPESNGSSGLVTPLEDVFYMEDEADRLHINKDAVWRLSSAWPICSTYHCKVIVPIFTPDVDLARLAPSHQQSRFPVVSWLDQSGAALLRASAPVHSMGDHTNRSTIQEGMFRAICTLNSSVAGRDEKLFIFLETLPSKKQPSKGSVNPKLSFYYPGCKFIYHDEFSIHAVRKSFKALRLFLHRPIDVGKYFSMLEETHWLQQISLLLRISSNAVAAIKQDSVSVLVAFEDGWDATTQVVSLAQIFLDPYYRTYDGFLVLIRKEWLAFSHHFTARHTLAADHCGKADAPIFLQWLDCVWQLLQQFPMAFEFNQLLLQFLAEESYSGRFGTFLQSGAGDRSSTFFECNFLKSTISVWTHLAGHEARERFVSELYLPEFSPNVLTPMYHIGSLKLWSEFYLKPFLQRSLLNHELQAADTNAKLILKYKTLLSEVKRHAQNQRVNPDNPEPVDSADGFRSLFNRSRASSANGVGRGSSFSLSPTSAESGFLSESTGVKASCSSPMIRLRGTSSENSSTLTRPMSMTAVLRSGDLFTDLNLVAYVKEKGLFMEADVRVNKHSCSGTLEKTGVGLRRAWRKRWFVLDLNKQYLTYFNGEETMISGRQPAGVISLYDISKVYQQEKKDTLLNHIFSMEVRAGRTFQLQAPNRGCLMIWTACLQRIVDINASRDLP